MGRRPGWSDEALVIALSGATSMAETCRRLGLSPAGSNPITVRKRIAALGLSTAHWTGRAWNRGRTGRSNRPAHPLETVLQLRPFRGNVAQLKRRLVAAGLLDARCSECGLTDWRGRPLTLQLDHVNGNRNDWRPENLRLICPNCHAQTETYCGRNRHVRSMGPATTAERTAPVAE